MKSSLKIIVAAAAFAAFPAFAQDCEAPDAPTIPSGPDVTEAQLVQAVGDVKTYQDENKAYRDCLDQKQLRTLRKAQAAGEEPDADKAKAHLKRYNASVEKESKVAEQLNTEIRTFKERQQ